MIDSRASWIAVWADTDYGVLSIGRGVRPQRIPMSCSSCTSSVAQAQQGAVRFQIDITLAKKSLEATKSQGEAIVQLLEAAAAVSNSEGKGAGLDAVA